MKIKENKGAEWGQPFRWGVPSAGFRLIEGVDHLIKSTADIADNDASAATLREGAKIEPWIATPNAQKSATRFYSSEVSYYDPKEYSGLFLDFSCLDPSNAEEIIAFANKYGSPLGESWLVADPETDLIVGGGETVRAWRVSVKMIRNIVSLWKAIRNNDADAMLARLNEEELKDNNIITPAKNQLIDMLNRTMMFRVSPGIELQDGKFASSIIAKDLYAFMLFQLLNAIVQETDFKRCPVCGTHFAVSTGSTRKSRTYCSTSCKLKASREKKKKALALHKEGLSSKEIAKQLDSTAKTVEGWIK